MDRFFHDLQEVFGQDGGVKPAATSVTDRSEVHDVHRQMTIWVVEVDGRLRANRMFGDGRQFEQTFRLGRLHFSCTRSIAGDVVETLRLLEVAVATEAEQRGLGPILTVNQIFA